MFVLWDLIFSALQSLMLRLTMTQKISVDPRIVSDKEKRNRRRKMANNKVFPYSLLICIILANQFQDINTSVLTVQKGAYKRLTVQVSEAVPRQLCHRAINNLQVGMFIIYTSNIKVPKFVDRYIKLNRILCEVSS